MNTTDSAPSTLVSSVACVNCRDKHLKCDGNLAGCSRCTSLNLSCHFVPSRRGRKTLSTPLSQVDSSMLATVDPLIQHQPHEIDSIFPFPDQNYRLAHPFLPPMDVFLQSEPAPLHYLPGQIAPDSNALLATVQVMETRLEQVQAFLLLAIVFHGRQQPTEARSCLAQAIQGALKLGLHRRETSDAVNFEDPTQAECRRPAVQVDGVLQCPIDTLDVPLPCEQTEYDHGCAAIKSATITDLERESILCDDNQFSSFAYRVEAALLLRKCLLAGKGHLNQEALDALSVTIASWFHKLPSSKRSMLDSTGRIDEMMLQAMALVHCASIYLHFPRSTLVAFLPITSQIFCSQPDIFSSPSSNPQGHTTKVTGSATSLSKIASSSTGVANHTPFFACVLNLSSIIQLAVSTLECVGLSSADHPYLTLNIGILKNIGETWPIAAHAKENTITMPNKPRRFACHLPGCTSSYQRKEHLRRHEAQHSGRLASACPFCTRTFARSDTLRRHVRRDHADSQSKLERVRASQACEACRGAKLRCRGGHPCTRCRQRGYQCFFDHPDPALEHEPDADADIDTDAEVDPETLELQNQQEPREQQSKEVREVRQEQNDSHDLDYVSATSNSLEQDRFQQWVHLYFIHFHPHWPILHRGTFDVAHEPPLLVQAVMMIGLWDSGTPKAKEAAIELHDKLGESIWEHRTTWVRKCTLQDQPGQEELEQDDGGPTSQWPIATYQGILLYLIFSLILATNHPSFELSLTFNLQPRDRDILSVLVSACLENNIFYYPRMLERYRGVENITCIWVGVEEIKRLGLALYRISCLCSSVGGDLCGMLLQQHENNGRLLHQSDLQFPPPDSEYLWEAGSNEELSRLLRNQIQGRPDVERAGAGDGRDERNWISSTSHS
ncbi:hypothetical protein BDW74DRAFT_185547 [Aspergillus multicolor]|uniref:uncharacterized protein n=1 Tax=Aspergillus multicolor TaxID=41759 RepID=UPI003CCE4862